MRIGIIDADLIGRTKHRFPNLACMKISAFHKSQGDTVRLLTSYEGLDGYDRLYLSKVFTDTPVPERVLALENLSYGGTGFFYDKAPPLPEEMEHHFPDYHLYDSWITQQLVRGGKAADFAFYTNYSIGFLTRGCFRQCSFCVNRNYRQVQQHSPLQEFLDPNRPKICLLDDNFFGSPRWEEMLGALQQTKKPFIFKQGLDERLLTEGKCKALFASKYDGDYIFAFDNVADAPLIESKIQLARKYTNAVMKFYCFCGFDRNDKWDDDFWAQDIMDLFIRIRILMRNRCLPYVMRFARYTESPYRGMYITIARWCNQPSFFKKKTFREFVEANGADSAAARYAREFELKHPECAEFFDMRFPASTDTV